MDLSQKHRVYTYIIRTRDSGSRSPEGRNRPVEMVCYEFGVMDKEKAFLDRDVRLIENTITTPRVQPQRHGNVTRHIPLASRCSFSLTDAEKTRLCA